MIENELYKNRSISGCIKAGFLLFFSNVATILRKNWLPIIVLSIIWGFQIGWSFVGAKQLLPSSAKVYGLIFSFIPSLLSLGAMIWFIGRVLTMINENTLKVNVKRVTWVILFMFLTMLLVTVFAISFQQTLIATQPPVKEGKMIALKTYFWIYPIVYLVFWLGMVPFSFSSTKYWIEQKARFKSTFFGGYRTGIKYFGFIFSTTLLTGLIVSLIIFVMVIPLIILLLSNTLSQIGVINGDPDTLPGYFPVLLYGISILTAFLLTSIIVIKLLIMYFVYGTVEVRKNAPKHRQLTQNDNLQQ